MILVYDNPATMCRECWQDGAMQASISVEVFALPPSQQPKHIHMGMNLLGAKFKRGQYSGDMRAMKKEQP